MLVTGTACATKYSEAGHLENWPLQMSALCNLDSLPLNELAGVLLDPNLGVIRSALISMSILQTFYPRRAHQ
jgi:hypothetical protein